MNTRRKFIVHRSSFIVLIAIACAQPQQESHEIRRVVSLAPNITEMAFAAGCGAKVVATDNFSDYPEAVKRLPKVGGVEPDVEKIAAMHPDLAIVSSSNAHPNLRRALAAAHVPLLVIRTDRLDQIAPAMAKIQHDSGCSSIVTITTALEKQRRVRSKAPSVMFAVWTDPLYVAGSATYLDDLLKLTGARNAVTTTGWPAYSLETFVAHPPDLFLYPNRSVTASAVAQLLARAHVHVETVAVDENVFTRPGPRVVAAAAELNRILDQWETSH
jgi:ABC-type hemin transport system substrate-binding protein